MPLTVNFLSSNPLHVDHPLFSVHLDHFSFSPLVRPTDNLDLVVLADRHRPNLRPPLTRRRLSALGERAPGRVFTYTISPYSSTADMSALIA